MGPGFESLEVHQFLPTLPARGATGRAYDDVGVVPNFYPRSPRGERPCRAGQRVGHDAISTHAPREGSDRLNGLILRDPTISTHAPREGSDGAPVSAACGGQYFYPRSPRGERLNPGWVIIEGPENNFYPRSPRGERPYLYGDNFRHHFRISTHAPREGSDSTT